MRLHYWWSRPDNAWLVADKATGTLVAKSLSIARVFDALDKKNIKLEPREVV